MGIDFAFLDSGTGGLPYMRYLKQQCPEARCVYLADTFHFPYGEKSVSQIIRYATDVSDLIIRKWQPKAVVIACNTMSVTALDSLRKRFPQTPFIGTVPAVKQAAACTRNGIIGLLATTRTVRDPYTDALIRKFAPGCTVVRRGDGALIDFIEHRLVSAPDAERKRAVQPAADFFKSHGADTVILGCTHFVHIADDIQEAVGRGVSVIDSRSGVVRQALKVAFTVPRAGKAAEREPLPADGTFFVTGFQAGQDESSYAELCRLYRIPWGGKLSPADYDCTENG
ncbi:glutamate racemase [Treponema brennaborense]|uniref:Glutamate racemase n=1 Tax=Treponema brennaborense (strain DSM 12168 / CIP 105900 / DD5/3) TaxID=906968 RepID=F4LJF9_TREBD|nr:glutamate racemase [Treponema brennaborense]AEE16354.1 Glutamate racemase [Treponema brennaborense DSM 12168]